MTRATASDERPVTEVELEYGLNSGIHVKAIGNGIVPIQEEHEARLERGIDLDAWARMSLLEKALLIAVRRNRVAMQNINTEAEIRMAERKSRVGRRK